MSFRTPLLPLILAAALLAGCGDAGADGASSAGSPSAAPASGGAPSAESSSAPKDRAPPNVLLLTLESLRPDHMGFQGGTRNTTPVLDALAEESVVYTNAHAVTSWTLTSHASLFTGLYPSAHATVTPLARLAASHLTLAESLAEAGYDTGGVASGPYLRKNHGLDQGFAWYDDALAAERSATAHAQVTNRGMLDAMRGFVEVRRDLTRPFFLFGYFWDPHYDYIPPKPYDGAFVERRMTQIDMAEYESRDLVHAGMPKSQLDFVLAQYDGEIRWTDKIVGDLFESLKEAGLWDELLVVVTSDHGEEFFEHGSKGHKNNLYRESIHVPLIVKYPRAEHVGRDDRLVNLVDVLPTVLEVAGVRHAAPVQGRSLLEAEPDAARAVFGELESIWFEFPPDAPPRESRRESWVSVQQGERKLIGLPSEARWELFDVSADPGEQNDLAALEPDTVEALRATLADHAELCKRLAEQHDGDDAVEVDEETMQGLRALGYVR